MTAAADATQSEGCTGTTCEDVETVELLQVQRSSSNVTWGNPLEKTPKFCVMGTLCAEQDAYFDYKELAALCIVMTAGGYNPMTSSLKPGNCAMNNFPCPASPSVISSEMMSPRMFEALPSSMRTLAQAAASTMMQSIQQAMTKALGQDVRIATERQGYSCPGR
jgi:hypothetical protein